MYYKDSDTLYIELRDRPILETRAFDENVLVDFDGQGNVCAITIEHASRLAGAPGFSYEEVSD
jgi:uncharacterized protein YuzE